jgi:monofunctional biosynthetic peptidoglycan transglycosylase
MNKAAKKGSNAKEKKSFFSRMLRWIRNILLFFFISTISVALIYKFIPVYVTPLMIVRSGEQLFNGEKLSMKKEWVSIDEISPSMVNAVVASEDNLFMSHFGFDFSAIEKAKERNKQGGRIYGASTISQQTAKNVFLWPQRSWLRKGLEVYFTFLIELLWTKERIMEVYLNVIETGDGIYGVQRASQIYFDKPASKLTPSQAALIAGALPNPLRFNPGKPSPYLYKRQNQILRIMSLIGNVDLKKKPEKKTEQKNNRENK